MRNRLEITQVISGGQTGVDRAALDAALSLSIPVGGWCPKERRAEDGKIPDVYPLIETQTRSLRHRTEQNVRDSDGTLILTKGKPSGGTALTIKMAKKHQKPFYVLDLDILEDENSIFKWLKENGIEKLNVAGPRESKCPGIYEQAKKFLAGLMKRARSGRRPAGTKCKR